MRQVSSHKDTFQLSFAQPKPNEEEEKKIFLRANENSK